MAPSSTLSRLIRCPSCQKPTRYDTANLFRPFCSERCKNVDIVGWAEEKYQIPTNITQDDGARDPHSESHDDEDKEF